MVDWFRLTRKTERHRLNKRNEQFRKQMLNEDEAHQLLSSYGIPVVQGTVVRTPEQAVAAGLDMGFPVVLKGIGAALFHKTEQHLVYLNLMDPQTLAEAAAAIVSASGNRLEGFLVQPQIQGQRELVAGLFHDEHFGPVIMFGLGGVYTEALKDVTFRLAPITEADAHEMLDEIKAKSLLQKIRGQKAADRKQLVRILTGLSCIAMERPEISEIDLNPILITPDGMACAVDALAVKRQKIKAPQYLPAVNSAVLNSFFHPESIAFVGASAQIGKWGHILLTGTISGGFQGEVYLVNPKGGTIAGRKAYRSLTEIPGHVDLTVVTIPAARVMDLIPQLREKEIHHMLLITSGFGETGKAGKALETALVEQARKAGIWVLGPNTMGICNPHIHLYCTGSHVRPLPGSTAVVAQSGNMGTQLLFFAEQQGIGIRGFCGSGNEAMIAIEDYLDAFEYDTTTRTVTLYIESIKNGRRFFESARRVGKKKPVVLLKGGQSRAGNRAAASHTGAMASDVNVFDAVCRQAGIIKLERPMDLLDLAAAFSSLPLPRGNRAAIMTLGGGWGVVTADLCSEYGLEVPELSSESLKRIDKLLPPYWSRSNPVDIVGEGDNVLPMVILEELIRWDGCDAVINLGIMGRSILVGRLADSVLKSDPTYSAEFIAAIKKELEKFEKKYVEHIVQLMKRYDKPIFGVSLMTDEKAQTVYRVADSPYKGLFYLTPERAVKAFAKMYEYQRFLTKKE
jgi:acyl-CoA synthetase (NDP forming)